MPTIRNATPHLSNNLRPLIYTIAFCSCVLGRCAVVVQENTFALCVCPSLDVHLDSWVPEAGLFRHAQITLVIVYTKMRTYHPDIYTCPRGISTSEYDYCKRGEYSSIIVGD